MSGVRRLELAGRGGGKNPLRHGAQATDAHGGAKQTAEPLQVPKKQGAWEDYPTTKPPSGNASPVRGEGPTTRTSAQASR